MSFGPECPGVKASGALPLHAYHQTGLTAGHSVGTRRSQKARRRGGEGVTKSHRVVLILGLISFLIAGIVYYVGTDEGGYILDANGNRVWHGTHYPGDSANLVFWWIMIAVTTGVLVAVLPRRPFGQ
jgi:hypothetical protein